VISQTVQPAAEKIYAAGTLVYSRAGVITLFGWLIWGDFVLTMMEQILPQLLPLLLKSNGATNEQIAMIVTTLALIMNAVLNPVISYKSDRFRSRWGRRRPFIIVTTPLVVLFLAAIPFAPDIVSSMKSCGLKLSSIGPVSSVILMFAALVGGFQIFNMFVSSVYSYLLPDVVPLALIGRFMGLFRLIGAVATIVFNYFILGAAQAHMKLIFVVTAVLYGFFILLMCWQVKEGDYPPPPVEDHGHWWSGIRNYAQECFGYSYYWWAFLVYSAAQWMGIANIFAVLFYRDEVGMPLDFIGRMLAWGSIFVVVLAYPFGILLDRWGCHKALILGSSLVAISSLLMFFFSSSRESYVTFTIIRIVVSGLTFLGLAKWTVEVYPRDRYGQFGSAGGLFCSLGGIVLGPVCGWWMGGAGHYRYYLVWIAFFGLITTAAAVIVYRKWKALGGPGNYQPPRAQISSSR
jgi:maltose/moltooligosaccharide transporter